MLYPFSIFQHDFIWIVAELNIQTLTLHPYPQSHKTKDLSALLESHGLVDKSVLIVDG